MRYKPGPTSDNKHQKQVHLTGHKPQCLTIWGFQLACLLVCWPQFLYMTTRNISGKSTELQNIAVSSSLPTFLNIGLAVATDKKLAAVAGVSVMAWSKVATVVTCLLDHWGLGCHTVVAVAVMGSWKCVIIFVIIVIIMVFAVVIVIIIVNFIIVIVIVIIVIVNIIAIKVTSLVVTWVVV